MNLSIYPTVKLLVRIVNEAIVAYSDIQSLNVLGKTGKLQTFSGPIACNDVAVQTWEFTNKNIESNC